jgi:hypothetical protein
MGEALCRLLERLPADRLPRAGGLSATVVVLLDYDKLLTGLGAAQLDTGEAVSAGLARRLLCEAGVVPAVYRRILGGPSVVLDVGRKARFHTEPQRIAMTLRDGGCTAEGCDRPPGWTEAHHDAVSCSDGGATSVDNGRLLCRFHHARALPGLRGDAAAERQGPLPPSEMRQPASTSKCGRLCTKAGRSRSPDVHRTQRCR